MKAAPDAESGRSAGSGARASGAADTRARLLETAVRLYAERGLDGVSLAEINRAAGQRNATALHYHFGGREGLVQAIFDKHTPRVNDLRRQLLDALPPAADVNAVVPVLVRPLAEQVRDPDGGIYYLQFLAQLMNNPTLQAHAMDRRENPVLVEQARRFDAALAHLPAAARELRVSFIIALVFNALAAYAREVQASGFEPGRHALVVEELIAATTGALVAH